MDARPTGVAGAARESAFVRNFEPGSAGGIARAVRRCVLTKLKKKWRELKSYPPGKRFQTVHEQQKDAPAWVKPVVIAGAVVAFGIGVLLSIMPGPAFVFYGLAGALLATESAWVARQLDRGEVGARKLIARWKRWRSRRKAAATRRKLDARA